MRPLLLFVVALVLVVASVSLVIASPLVLDGLDTGEQDWNRLSEIGQTYGAVSAIIAVIALVGVMVSLIIQSRKPARLGTQHNETIYLNYFVWRWTIRATWNVGDHT